MVATAFVATGPLGSAFTTASQSLLLQSTRSSHRGFAPRPRRCRVQAPTPVARVGPPPRDDTPAPDALADGPADALAQFPLALMGAYAALSGVSPANAVPESLVTAFKSKPASLAHPIVMWGLLFTCLFTFYLGYQSSMVRKVEPERRKELIKGKFADRHFRTSSVLFAVMTIATFSGMANTYTRTGKLFPGPHLYAGLGLVALMSVMSSLVPYMQKGKDWARNTHFTLAFAAVGLFGWQAKSGMDIVAKLLGWK